MRTSFCCPKVWLTHVTNTQTRSHLPNLSMILITVWSLSMLLCLKQGNNAPSIPCAEYAILDRAHLRATSLHMISGQKLELLLARRMGRSQLLRQHRWLKRDQLPLGQTLTSLYVCWLPELGQIATHMLCRRLQVCQAHARDSDCRLTAQYSTVCTSSTRGDRPAGPVSPADAAKSAPPRQLLLSAFVS